MNLFLLRDMRAKYVANVYELARWLTLTSILVSSLTCFVYNCISLDLYIFDDRCSSSFCTVMT